MAEVLIRDEAALLALHRALMELHFVELPNDPAVIGSSFVATIANQTLDALIDIEESRGNQKRVDQWKTWRRLDHTRREWRLLIRRLHSINRLLEMPWEQQQELIRCYASPFVVDAKAILAEIDAA
jgi:hypothetical protein